MLSEKLARLSRLRKQRKEIMKRGHEMVRRGLSSLDELDESDRVASLVNSEVALESEAAVEAQEVGAFGVVDWGAMFEGADLSASAFLGLQDGLTGGNIGSAGNVGL